MENVSSGSAGSLLDTECGLPDTRTLSRDNSLSSLPATEFGDWPDMLEIQMPYPHEALKTLGLHGVGGTNQAPCPPPAGQLAPSVVPASVFQVAFLGGIEVRMGPSFDAPRTGVVLMQHHVFGVSQQIQGADGRVYLCLADRQGWVFDDAALCPHDPSVIQVPCSGHQAETAPPLAPMPHAGQETGQQTGTTPPVEMPVPVAMPTWPLVSEGLLGSDPSESQAPPVMGARCMPPPPPNHPAPGGELLASSPSSHAAPAGELLSTATPTSVVLNQPCQPHFFSELPLEPASNAPIRWYRVAYLGGINLRCGPSVEAPCTGVTLPQMEVFASAEEVPGQDGRVYLRLCDGRGWAFDDTSLMPHDPSVKHGQWMAPCGVYDTRGFEEVQAGALSIRRRHAQPRGKRGGKRCSRRSKLASSLAGPAAVEA